MKLVNRSAALQLGTAAAAVTTSEFGNLSSARYTADCTEQTALLGGGGGSFSAKGSNRLSETSNKLIVQVYYIPFDCIPTIVQKSK